MGLITAYRRAADRQLDDWETAAEAPAAPGRAPLSAGQHILHLLLSVVTGGLWLPVWFIRAWRGNPPPRGLAVAGAAGHVQVIDQRVELGGAQPADLPWPDPEDFREEGGVPLGVVSVPSGAVPVPAPGGSAAAASAVAVVMDRSISR